MQHYKNLAKINALHTHSPPCNVILKKVVCINLKVSVVDIKNYVLYDSFKQQNIKVKSRKHFRNLSEVNFQAPWTSFNSRSIKVMRILIVLVGLWCDTEREIQKDLIVVIPIEEKTDDDIKNCNLKWREK